MKVTVKQIRKLDRIAIDRFGVPSLALMENAGRGVAKEVFSQLRGKKKVCVVCGSGNNGGDGFVTARHLINKGCRVSLILVGQSRSLKHDAAVNHTILKKLKYPIINVGARHAAPLRRYIKKSDIVVDAIFGVGLNRNIAEPYKSVIEEVNKYAKRIIAVDIPSGLDGTTGKIFGVCIKANTTVTFTFAKKGFIRKLGPEYVGKINVIDIGIPKALHKFCR